ncbi:MAG: hypothetical protein ACI85V_003176, partial [bacterium]
MAREKSKKNEQFSPHIFYRNYGWQFGVLNTLSGKVAQSALRPNFQDRSIPN